MSKARLPSHASVAVVGGGVMGCSTLYHLAKLGVGDAILLGGGQPRVQWQDFGCAPAVPRPFFVA